jgi:hypothetical protein
MFALFSILVQTPAPVNDIKVTPSNTSAQVTLGNTAPETSSYITHYYIKLNEHYLKTIRRQESRTEFRITGLTAFTKYTVTIYAGDGSSQWSSRTDKVFTTNAAGEDKRWFTEYILTMYSIAHICFYNYDSASPSGPVVQRWVSADLGLKFNLLFWLVYFCTSVYFKTSEK